jgi:anti-sigma regulatory factor (Ser/Thr protein kinase)
MSTANVPRAMLPDRLLIESPAPFFRAASAEPPLLFDLDKVDVAQVFALTGIAALARANGHDDYAVRTGGGSGASRFAHAIGFDEALAGLPQHSPGIAGRTVKLRRIMHFEEIESAASEISHLILPGEEEGRRTIYYVLVELLRNVVQHSHDPMGGVVAAQRMDQQQQYTVPAIQVAVADAGIGIREALRGLHPELKTPGEALEKALRPHISGTFEEGLTGSQQNAGMGLFFISEMAKLTAGRLLVASRGDAVLLEGDLEGNEIHKIKLLGMPGFPGTLVSFELPLGEVRDFNALIQRVAERAKARTPQRAVHHWLKYEEPGQLIRFLVRQTSEDTVAAQHFASEELESRLLEKQSFILDFRGIEVTTQSYLHALLFEVLRLAWARRIPIYIANAAPAVKSGLDLLESYALGG